LDIFHHSNIPLTGATMLNSMKQSLCDKTDRD